MNAPKPNQSFADQTCPVCQQGRFALVQIDHIEEVLEQDPITFRGVWVDRCENCGEIVFPSETTQFLESVVAEQSEHLDQRELERVREDLGVPHQDQMSEILGLGTKTYHKWEGGAQFPTRSMCYYIRVVAEFPQAFDWLRRRAWRDKNRLLDPQATKNWKTMFPDLAAVQNTESFHQRSSHKKANPALGLSRVAFVTR